MNRSFFSTLCILILCFAGIVQAQAPVITAKNLPNGEVSVYYREYILESGYNYNTYICI